MKLSGHTTPFAVLGHPIGHTLSPVMHNASIQSLGLDATYLAFDVAPEKLMNVLTAMGAMGFGGVNLTVPLKEVAFHGLENLDASAKRLGAVNTIEFSSNGMCGHNTDGSGFIAAIKESLNIETLTDKSVFVLGSGGAGRALALTCADKGAKKISLADIDEERSAKVAEEILNSSDAEAVQLNYVEKWNESANEADLIIQATPVGMKPGDKSLLKPEAFKQNQCVFDLVYMYPQTDLMRVAHEKGAKVSNGLGMLMHQGARSFTIWTGSEPDTKSMTTALENEVYKN